MCRDSPAGSVWWDVDSARLPFEASVAPGFGVRHLVERVDVDAADPVLRVVRVGSYLPRDPTSSRMNPRTPLVFCRNRTESPTPTFWEMPISRWYFMTPGIPTSTGRATPRSRMASIHSMTASGS